MLGAWCLPAGWASLRNWIWVPRWTKRNPRNPRSISSKSHLQEGRWIIYEYDIWYTHIYIYICIIYIWYMIWIWYDSTVMALRPLDSPRRHPSIRRVQRRPKWASIFFRTPWPGQDHEVTMTCHEAWTTCCMLCVSTTIYGVAGAFWGAWIVTCYAMLWHGRGSTASGHYVAYARDRHNRWPVTSVTSVTSVPCCVAGFEMVSGCFKTAQGFFSGSQNSQGSQNTEVPHRRWDGPAGPMARCGRVWSSGHVGTVDCGAAMPCESSKMRGKVSTFRCCSIWRRLLWIWILGVENRITNRWPTGGQQVTNQIVTKSDPVGCGIYVSYGNSGFLTKRRCWLFLEFRQVQVMNTTFGLHVRHLATWQGWVSSHQWRERRTTGIHWGGGVKKCATTQPDRSDRYCKIWIHLRLVSGFLHHSSSLNWWHMSWNLLNVVFPQLLGSLPGYLCLRFQIHGFSTVFFSVFFLFWTTWTFDPQVALMAVAVLLADCNCITHKPDKSQQGLTLVEKL